MKNVAVSCDISKGPLPTQTFPAGTKQGKYRIDVGAGTDKLVDDPTVETMFSLADGKYTATIQALDSEGNLLGPAMTKDFEIAADVQLNVAGPVRVTIS